MISGKLLAYLNGQYKMNRIAYWHTGTKHHDWGCKRSEKIKLTENLFKISNLNCNCTISPLQIEII